MTTSPPSPSSSPKKYRTIVCDPPWKYTGSRLAHNAEAEQDDRRGAPAEARYDTMTSAAIRELPVGKMAAEEAHLYLWVTNPRLFQGYKAEPVSAFDIMRSWGFEYKTMLTWVKTGAPGLGFYFRGMTEHVLFGTRGGLGIPATLRQSNVITAPRGKHSEKPGAFMDLVQRVSPAPRVELFARTARLGWDSWGDESLGTAEMPA